MYQYSRYISTVDISVQ